MTTTLSAGTESSVSPYHWTVDAYYRAINAGVFEHPERLELIHGGIIEKMGQNPPHAALATRIARRLRVKLEPRFFMREERPIRIAFDGEPVPDISVLSGGEDDYNEVHPTPEDVVLLVEVADSAVSYDTRGKAMLYAQAGISEYWVALLPRQILLVHREPTPEGYKAVIELSLNEIVSPLAASEITFSVGELLGVSSESKG